jgi:hypothetical protein
MHQVTMESAVLRAESRERLQQMIDEYIKAGWKQIGEPTVTDDGDHRQTMSRWRRVELPRGKRT